MKDRLAGFKSEIRDWYLAKFLPQVGCRKVGLEKEIPVVWQNNFEAADGRLLFKGLVDQGWQPVHDEINKEVILSVKKDGVEVTTEAGFCTLEVIMPPHNSVGEAINTFQRTEALLQKEARNFGMLLLKYGIQPKTNCSPELWIEKRRHQVIRKALPEGVNIVTITASDQVHVEITQAEIIDSINIFNAISGVFIRLFANSPIWQNQVDAENRLAVREDAWRFVAENRIGMPSQPFANVDDFLSFMFNLELCVARENGDYITPRTSYLKYVTSNPAINWQHHWFLQEGMTWLNARARAPYSTIEVRPACCNDLTHTAALAAFCLGIGENLGLAKELVTHHPWSFWQKMRKQAMYGQHDYYLEQITEQLLVISKQGLQKRGLKEETFLEPLWQYLAFKTNPAKELLKVFKTKGWEDFSKRIVL